ncbi:glutamate racemase [Herbaspirillum autotrophicum]|uniref:glutamate racemase n=1 Tax=Herbaspirillum autotrophicum TaxID=180195 RepID=UPI00067DBBB9|nr:glutamate racemase [Herbaspirillum autotrophicum]
MSDVMSDIPLHTLPVDAAAPIGIFDSGLGGLSVLRHIHAGMPQEHLLYFADSGYAPYGDKSDAAIVQRSLAVAGFLVEHGIKALVVACNTATAAAIQAIRSAWPTLVVVGIEPGLKPAAQLSNSKIIGVLATRSTIASPRFQALRQQIEADGDIRFLTQACVGLADQVEKAELSSVATAQLVDRYVRPLLAQGADTLVLGCTHYPFVRALIESAATDGPAPIIIDTGEAVTRQLARRLASTGLQRPAQLTGSLSAWTTGSAATLTHAFVNLLKLNPPVSAIATAPGNVNSSAAKENQA